MSEDEGTAAAVATARSRLEKAEAIADETNGKPYTRIPNSKTCVRALQHLCTVWMEKREGVCGREEEMDMTGFIQGSQGDWDTAANRLGFTKVSDASVNFIDYLFKETRNRRIFSFECDEDPATRQGMSVTEPAQLLSGKLTKQRPAFVLRMLFFILFSFPKPIIRKSLGFRNPR